MFSVIGSIDFLNFTIIRIIENGYSGYHKSIKPNTWTNFVIKFQYNNSFVSFHNFTFHSAVSNCENFHFMRFNATFSIWLIHQTWIFVLNHNWIMYYKYKYKYVFNLLQKHIEMVEFKQI